MRSDFSLKTTTVLINTSTVFPLHTSYLVLLHTDGGCEKRETHINWSMVMQRQHPLLELS